MTFKINISDKGKTYKIESESEVLVGKKIDETFKGEDLNENLKGYEIKITGTSDLSGIPGFKGLEGTGYHRKLLTIGPGMKDRRKGIRLRKTQRGEEISLKTHQINSIVVKQGDKKFEDLVKKEVEASPSEKKAEPAKEANSREETSEKPLGVLDKEEKKEETKPQEKEN